MIHYLAELFTNAKQAKGSAKRKLERECFEVILQLWKHRAHIDSRSRPMASFEPIYEALSELHNHSKLYYLKRSSDENVSIEEEWLRVAESIDRSARDLIAWCISLATASASAKEQTWLESLVALELGDCPEIEAARELLERQNFYIKISLSHNTEDDDDKFRVELNELNERITRFQAEMKLLGQVTKNLQKDIKSALKR